MIPDLSTHNRPSSVTVHSRTFLRSLRTVAVAFLGALLALALVGPTQDQVGPLTLQYHIALRAEGGTTVNLPPLGNISFPTHLGPIHLEVTVLNVDITALTPDLIAAGKRTHVVTDDPPELASLALGPSGVESMKRELQHRLLRYAARIFIFAWIGSSSLLMLASYKPRDALLSATAAILTGALAMGGIVVWTYDHDAWSQPKYEGALALAPWAVDAARDAVSDLQKLGRELNALTANLAALHRREATEVSSSALEEEGIHILVVSDLHNNPLGVDWIRELTEHFDIDLILDAGDLTDYGTAPELELSRGIESLPVSYLLTPGNHEAPAALRALETFAGVRVLDGRSLWLEGVHLVGIPDPASSRSSPVEEPQTVYDRIAEDAHARFRRTGYPTVLIAHHPRLAEAFLGEVPLVIAGHSHRLQVEEVDGSVYVNPGTTGGAGLRGLLREQELPMTAAIVHLGPATTPDDMTHAARGNEAWQVYTVDTIEAQGLQSLRSVRIRREWVRYTQESLEESSRFASEP